MKTKKMIQRLVAATICSVLSLNICASAAVWNGLKGYSGWSVVQSWGDALKEDFSIDSSVSYKGDSSLKIAMHTASVSGSEASIRSITKPLEAGKKYKLSLYLKTDGEETVELDQPGADRWPYAGFMTIVTPTNQLEGYLDGRWEKNLHNSDQYDVVKVREDSDGKWYKFTLKDGLYYEAASDGVHRIELAVNHGDRWENIWIDDIALTEIGGDGTNYISNPSFENDLQISNWKIFQASGNLLTTCFGIDSNYKYSGDTSLKIAEFGGISGEHEADVRTYTGVLEAGKSYKLSFYEKTEQETTTDFWGWGRALKFIIADNKDYGVSNEKVRWQIDQAFTSEKVRTEADGTSWHKLVSKDVFIPEETKSYVLAVRTHSNMPWHSVWLDDFAITEVGGDGTNFMYNNAGFEVTEIEESVEDGPVNLISTMENSPNLDQVNVTLSWKNPKNAGITGYTLSMGETDLTPYLDTVLSSSNLPTGAAAKSAYCHMTLSQNAGQECTYTVGIVTNEGTYTKDINVKAMISESDIVTKFGDITPYGWTLKRFGSVLPYTDVSFTNEAKTGDTALKIISNSTYVDGVGSELVYTVTVDKNKVYKLQYMVKNSAALTVAAGYNLINRTDYNWLGYIGNAWEKYEHYIDASKLSGYDAIEGDTAELKLIFAVSGNTDGVIFDDVSLTEVGTDKNLIRSGSFEYEIKDASVEGNVIRWTMPEAADWDYVNIYKKNNSGTYDKITSATGTSYTISTQEAGIYKLVPAIGDVELSGGTEVEVIEAPAAKITVGTPTFNLMNGAEIAEADIKNLKSGKVQAVLPICNTTNEDVAVSMYFALYKDGALISVAPISTTLVKNSQVADPITTTIDVEELEAGSVYKAKLMLWNDKMEPVMETAATLAE